MKRSSYAACLAITFVVGACSADPRPDSPSDSGKSPASPSHTPVASARVTPSPELVALSTPPILTADEVPLWCCSPLRFDAQALLAPAGAELADHPAAEALRQLIAGGSVPRRSGWRLVVLTEDSALFLLRMVATAEHPFWYAELERAGSDWQGVRWGQCDLKPGLEGGVDPARWELLAGEQPSPDSRSLKALVFETVSCASGMSPEGRIVGPAITYQADSVIVIFGVRPLTGPQTCQPGPPAEATIELDEPLGERQLLDGWVFPPEPRSPSPVTP